MLHFACSTEYFPLTLTLSLREREQQASDWCFADGYWADSGTGVNESRWTILPLPRERAGVETERSPSHGPIIIWALPGWSSLTFRHSLRLRLLQPIKLRSAACWNRSAWISSRSG